MKPNGQFSTGIMRAAVLAFVAIVCLISFLSWPERNRYVAAASTLPFEFNETPLARGPGDQTRPAVDNGKVIYLDASDGSYSVKVTSLAQAPVELVAGAVLAGPEISGEWAMWQDPAGLACLSMLTGEAASRCLAAPPADVISLWGETALSGHDGAVIRLINFTTMRTRILDSSTTAGGRYDPSLSADGGVWVKERGYAGKYYEPLIVLYDVAADSTSYLTKMGGGSTSFGQSIYERRNPDIDEGRVIYQQKISGGDWDIYEAVADTFGAEIVSRPGDQINPAISQKRVVFQDDNAGLGENGWDIFMKDLESGLEIPVCQASGDQINPVISGDLIVWQDNRDGDWDIYAAQVSRTTNEPTLGIALGRVYWRDYADYIERRLTVGYTLSNSGPGKALSPSIQSVQTVPAAVMLEDELPLAATDIEPGLSASLEMRFIVPPAVRGFRTIMYASCLDGAAQQRWFPGVPPA